MHYTARIADYDAHTDTFVADVYRNNTHVARVTITFRAADIVNVEINVLNADFLVNNFDVMCVASNEIQRAMLDAINAD